MEEGWNKRNMTLMDELFDPGYVYHGVVEGEIIGVEAMKQFLTSLYAAFPDDQHMIQEQVAEGDKVVTRFKSTGTAQVEFMGIAPSGKQITVDEVSISRIAGGRIAEDWNTWDVLGLFRQLGAGPQATEANKALVRRMIEEGWNKHNLALLDELYADCVYYNPATGEIKGEALKQFLASMLVAFPDIRFTIEDLVAEGDKVVTRWSCTGTHRGEFMGLAPTGKQLTPSALDIFRIVEGKVVEERVEFDTLRFFQQLGALPPLAKAEDKAAA
jgi:steroid delta-isomerase-like uncharacterized protein